MGGKKKKAFSTDARVWSLKGEERSGVSRDGEAEPLLPAAAGY